jgi:RNA polymerase subunit RPABC4/transcription elongation factor Spt4
VTGRRLFASGGRTLLAIGARKRLTLDRGLMNPPEACPECGTRVTEGVAACPGCGFDLRDRTRPCAKCGETIAEDSEACPACGHLMVEAHCDRHPDREAQGQCALCATTLCQECDAGDRNYHRCVEHGDVPIIEGWAEVLSLADEVEGRLIEENLRAEGVEARMLSQKDHSAFPVDLGDLARIRILVPTYAYQEGRRLIDAHRDSVGEVGFGCPNCGEPYEERATVCEACGEALV